jgi:hypothetical protein
MLRRAAGWSALAIVALATAVLAMGGAIAAAEPSPAASLMPAAGASGAPSVVGTPEPGGWAGFRARAEPFALLATAAIGEVRDAMFSGNSGAVVGDLLEAAAAGTDLIAWLDANKPEACYQTAWAALRDAAALLAPTFAELAANGLEGAMDGLIRAGTALVAADDAITEARLACGDAVPSPAGSPVAGLAVR